MASELSSKVSQANPPRLSRDRLIPTQQYTANTPQNAPNNQLQWVAPQQQQPVQTVGVGQPGNQPTTATPTPTAPAYGDNWPRQTGPERAVNSPQGPYMPGPIFAESSPFRDGPPDGGLSLQPLPFNVNAEETMTGRIMFGVGVNSDSGLVGSVVLDEQNFDAFRFPTSFEDIKNGTAWRGAGKRFRMEAAPGTQTSRYSISYQDPYLMDTKVSMGLSGFYYQRIYDAYTESRLGGRVAMGYQLTPDLSATVAYRGAKINISNPEDPALPDLAEVINRDLALHGFAFSLTHDKRDSAFLPTEGHLAEWQIEQVLGSFQYLHSEIDLRKYFTLYERPDGSGRQVLTLAAKAGITGDDTPIYDRYYAGGYSTIRGFRFRWASPTEVGPTNGAMIVTGGDFELFTSAEYMFPITADDMLRAVVFCDAGTVEPRFDQWSNRYRVAPGFGLRICVPAMGPAPIALDFAFPISWQPGDKQEMFSFFMGFGR
jgi:outer membrane protein insertion porin family